MSAAEATKVMMAAEIHKGYEVIIRASILEDPVAFTIPSSRRLACVPHHQISKCMCIVATRWARSNRARNSMPGKMRNSRGIE